MRRSTSSFLWSAVLAAVLSLAFAAPGAARGDVVYSNLGAGDTFNTGPNAGELVMAGQACATPFTVPIGGLRLATIELALGRSVTGAPTAVKVSLALDGGNKPGTVVETISVPNGTVTTPRVIAASSGTKPSLQEGVKYWVVVSVAYPNEAIWYENSTGAVDRGFTSFQTGAWIMQYGVPAWALRVSGVPNEAPIADAGLEQTVTVQPDGDPTTNTASVTLDGSASSDPDGDLLTYSWAENGSEIATGTNPTVNLQVGDHNIALTVDDGHGGTATAYVLVHVLAESNQPPLAEAGPDQVIPGIHDGDPDGNWAWVTLDGSGSTDPNGDQLSYVWTDEECDLWVTGVNPTFALGGERFHLITLTVTDPSGASSTDYVMVEITPEPNQPPVAEAGAARSIQATHGGNPATDVALVDIGGGASYDPDGDTIDRYLWKEGDTEVGWSERLRVSERVGPHTFSLTVWDPYHASSTPDDVTITVTPAPNQAPVAKPEADRYVAVPHDGDPATNTAEFTLRGYRSSDPDGDHITSYQWTEGGTALGGGATLTLNRPVGTYTFTLTVTDTYGATGSANVVVRVDPEPNSAPMADAGTDQTLVATGVTTPVTLDGSASYDWDDEDLSFSWTEGGTVIGTGIAPTVKLAGGVHTITLTVTDPYGESSTDTVVVSVTSALDISAGALAKNGRIFTITVTITNPNAFTVTNVTVNAARLDGSDSNSPLPMLFGSMKPGTSKQCKLQFKAVAPDANGQALLTINGTCSLGAFFTAQLIDVQ